MLIAVKHVPTFLLISFNYSTGPFKIHKKLQHNPEPLETEAFPCSTTHTNHCFQSCFNSLSACSLLEKVRVKVFMQIIRIQCTIAECISELLTDRCDCEPSETKSTEHAFYIITTQQLVITNTYFLHDMYFVCLLKKT